MRFTNADESIKVIQALSVTQRIARGMGKQDACNEVGLTLRQYDYWIAKDNNALVGLQNAIVEAERIRLADITNAYAIILHNLLQQVVQPGIDPAVALKVLNFLDGLKAELEKKHGVHSETDEAEAYLLKGPRLRNEESKMTVEIRANQDGSVSLDLPVRQQIVEATFQNSQDENREDEPKDTA
jgi:hypothetical protein